MGKIAIVCALIIAALYPGVRATNRDFYKKDFEQNMQAICKKMDQFSPKPDGILTNSADFVNGLLHYKHPNPANRAVRRVVGEVLLDAPPLSCGRIRVKLVP